MWHTQKCNVAFKSIRLYTVYMPLLASFNHIICLQYYVYLCLSTVDSKLLTKPSFEIIQRASRCLRLNMRTCHVTYATVRAERPIQEWIHTVTDRCLSETGWTQICLASVMRESTAWVYTDEYMMRWMKRVTDIKNSGKYIMTDKPR